jgi:hypothetical protein
MLAGAPAEPKRTACYLLQAHYLKAGPQLPALHEFLSKSFLPALREVHSGPQLFLEALVAPHIPQLLAIYGFESLDQIDSVSRSLARNDGFQKKLTQLESGPEPPFERLDSMLLEAADYSPEIVVPTAPPRAAGRIFELRVYHSPSWRQLRALHERFAGPEVEIFQRSGVHPLFYSSTVVGANMPNLAYLIPFDSLAAREQAWAAFGADPEWIKVRQESVEKYGQISSIIGISLYRATAWSPVR